MWKEGVVIILALSLSPCMCVCARASECVMGSLHSPDLYSTRL